MARNTFVLGAWVMGFAGIACAGSGPIDLHDGSAFLSEVNRKGASQVIRQLRDTPDWYRVTERIASGEPAWIDAAVALRAGSDAGSTSELQSALLVALSKNPVYGLRVLEPIAKSPSRPFTLAEICGGRNDPSPTYQEAITEHRRVKEAVGSVQLMELASKKALCLAELKKGEAHIKRFFGVAEQAE